MTLNGETLENRRRRAPPAVFHNSPFFLTLNRRDAKNAFVAAAEAMASSTARSMGKLVAGRVVPAPAPTPRPTTTTRAKGMTYFQRLAADAEAARQARLERLKAEAKAAEEAGALGLKKGEAD